VLRPFVTRSIVECVSSIWRGMGGIRGILRLERKLIDSVPHLSGDGGKQRARSFPLPILVPFPGNADHSRPPCTIPPTQGLGNLILSDCLWDRGCSLWKLLVSPPEKTGNPIISHANSPPHLRYSHAPPQHLHVIPIDLSSYWVHVPTRNTTRWPHVSSDYTYSHHLGRKWVHGENYNPPPGTKAHSASDLALCHLVSGRV
jgi:hypothetical protein